MPNLGRKICVGSRDRWGVLLWLMFFLSCKGNVNTGDKGCEHEADCSPPLPVCNPLTHNCSDCAPTCAGRCCGKDGCGRDCQDQCSQTSQQCNQETCLCEGSGSVEITGSQTVPVAAGSLGALPHGKRRREQMPGYTKG